MSDPTDDFDLTDLLTVDQLVERYPILTRGELLSAMRFKRLRHWPKGRQRFTTERWVREWIMTQVRGGEGDVKKGAVPASADPEMTSEDWLRRLD